MTSLQNNCKRKTSITCHTYTDHIQKPAHYIQFQPATAVSSELGASSVKAGLGKPQRDGKDT